MITFSSFLASGALSLPAFAAANLRGCKEDAA